MGFADDLINKKKKREEESDFVNQVISGNYKVGKINVEPDFSGFKSVTQKNKVTLPTTSKKQTTNVIQPTITTKTNRANELQNLLSERNSTIYSPKTRTNSLNNSALNVTLQPNKLDEARQQAEELKNYSKNDKINKLASENYEDKGMKVLLALDSLRRKTPQEKLETALKTTGNAITNVGHGAGKAVENFYDFSLNASNNVNTALEEAFGIKSKEEAAKSRQKAADIIKRDLTTEAENKLGWTDELRDEWEKNSLIKRNNIGGQVFQGIGEMIPTIFVGNAMGGVPSNATKVQKLISSIPTTQTLGVSSYGSALEEAYNEGATTSQANKYALGSMLTEVTTEWLTGGVPGVNNSGILDNLEEKTLDKVSNNMAKFLIKEGYNVVGEGSEEALAEIIKPYLKNATYTQGQKVNWNDVLQSAIVGGITGGVLDAPGNIAEYNRNQAQTPAQRVIQQQEQRKAELLNQQRQQTTPIQDKTTLDNINIPTTENVAENGLKQATNNYQYVQSENAKIDNLRKDASTYWNNSEKTQNFVNMLEKIVEDKGVEIRLDPNLTDETGKLANGKYQNGVITINPRSSRVGEFVAIHELTHAIGTDSMRNIVENYRKSNSEFNKAVTELLGKTYNTTELTEEAMADVAGQLFGNQEFINNLSMKQPNLFKRIYNEIKYLWHQFTGYKNSNQFIDDLKNKWESAYRSNKKLNGSENYNIQENDNYSKEEVTKTNNLNEYIADVSSREAKQNELNRQSVKESILEYLDDNNITNPTKKDMMDAFGWYDEYDASQDMMELRQAEKLYSEVADELLKENSTDQKDSQGRTLSKQQQNYFKDSKVRDKDGNLVTLYHGTPNDFTVFNTKDFGGANGTAEGFGIYLTDNIEVADDYLQQDKGKVMNLYANITKPATTDNLTVDKQDVIRAIKELTYKEVQQMVNDGEYDNINDALKDTWISNYTYTYDKSIEESYKDVAKTILESSENDYEVIQELMNGSGNNDYKRANDFYTTITDTLGFDGIKTRWDFSTDSELKKKNADIWIAFKPNQVKNIDNINPTTNEDIRYSKDNQTWKDYLEKEFKQTGTTTKLGDLKLPTAKKTTLPSKTTTEVKTTPSEAKIPVKESVTTKVEEKPKVVSKLSTEEAKELRTLNEIDDAFGLEPEEEARKQFLEKKQQGYVERFPGLKKVKDFKEISRDYGKYKDLSNFDNKLLKEAEGIVPSYRDTGRRTKEQWLEVAKYIGNNFKGNSSENLTKYAIQSWFDAQPNQKDTLNRQGSKYVDFKIQDWINEVYDGARIGELEKPLVPTTEVVQPKKEQVSLPAAKNNDVIKVSNDIAKQINNTGGFNLKQRSWAETSTESDVLKGKVLIEDLDPGKLNYVVQSNKKSLDTANRHIDTYGYEKSLADVKSMLRSDGLPKASDVALMQRMIQEATKRGDYATAQDLIMDTAILGTDLGQATQALSMIKRLTPEGQLTMYTKLVERAKARGEKSFQNVEITPEMVQNILEAYNKDGTYNQDDLNARVEKFKQDLANQMKSTLGDKIDAWRYLSMLGNPKTHIRNMVSNIAMTGTIKVKNAMARTLETLLPVKERTKTWKASSKDVKEFSKQTAINMKDIITGEAKYNEKSAIESKKQIFNNKTLEKLSNFNSNALEAEDWFFSKRAFQSTLQEYLTANGIETYEDIKNNPELVEKAKNYAREQAEIATFRQYSKLASTINNLERKNKGARLAIQALVPFKKTPINVAKAGVNYSPLGLLKTISYDTYQLQQGNINASQYIDNLSQGMTGTSLTLLGYALAKAGILSGSGGDDKEDKYDSQLGNTGYSINVGGKSYSISWLSPVAMPMLVGANAYEQLEEGKDWDMNVVSDSLAKTLDPLNEMSFMQGITNALNSYSSGVDKWKGIAESTVQNYIGQFFPTLFSQIASTTDDTKRSTKASSNSTYKFGEQTVRSIMYKIPGLRQQLEPATDIWGNEKKQSENILERAFESFLAPYSKTEHIATDLDNEIKRVYNETGDKGVIPSIPYGYTKYDGETYRMSAKEYTEYKKTYGNTANTTLNSLINSSDYKEATEEEKAKMIDNVYDYARAKANEEYFQGVDGVNYSNKTLEKIDSLNDMFGISASTYYANKKEYDYAYQYPEKYTTITQIAPYDKYTKYKDEIDDIRSNTSNDKEETINYINSLNMSVPQKAMFIKQYYKSFKQYDNEIVEYINSKKLTTKQKEQVLGNLGFTIKDGRVYY